MEMANQSTTIKSAEKRSEILELIDRKYAKIGNLITLYMKMENMYENLHTKNDEEIAELKRIKHNLNFLRETQNEYDEERKGAEGYNNNFHFSFNQNTLSNIKRLLIHIEEEILKENRNLEFMSKKQ